MVYLSINYSILMANGIYKIIVGHIVINYCITNYSQQLGLDVEISNYFFGL